ncbi:unnamed protein product [Didymodactylos carnosus]|uniref:Uncharacterized protein n=1 Tax=Didymodactylos carnosus TaxID=1234261 RepID=A0A815R153_9BILA|nr:unnamed protein product [Didymodactylos carnosus]CAF4338524.1 unnamed protein product [Didymodactylos carnosus]
MRFNSSNQPCASHIPSVENTRLSQEASQNTAYRHNHPSLMSIDPAYIPELIICMVNCLQVADSAGRLRFQVAGELKIFPLTAGR